MASSAPYSLVAATAAPRSAWAALYSAYADFYASPQNEATRERVWGWLHDPSHELDGFVALDRDGQGLGLVHFHPFVRPLAASIGGFIDDLYVVEHRRGSGLADALVTAVVDEGRRRGWSVVRWITAESNERARRFYERVADETDWVTYQVLLP